MAVNVAARLERRRSGDLRFWFTENPEDRKAQAVGEMVKLTLPPKFKVNAEQGNLDEKLTVALEGLDALGKHPVPVSAVSDSFGFKGVLFSVLAR